MKSVYIITGGILAVIAVVFLAPQKKMDTIAEEKALNPLDEIDAIILKEYGDDLTPENKEIVRQEIADRLARDKAEMRKYGRLLTDEELSTQWWREQDEAAAKAAYAALYEERKDWIDNFPFRPGYHPDIVYDPENNIAHSDEKFHAYREELERKGDELWHERGEKSREIWARTDLSLEEKHEADDKLYWEMEAAREPDPEIMAERRIIMRHKWLAGFYEQHYRYLPEFEQAYRIFKEEGAGDNPVQIADTMASLEMYKEASKHDPEELHQYFAGPMEGKEGNHPYTNQQFLDRGFHWIVNTIADEYNFLPGETPTSREQAERIAKRLVEEIPADGFTGNTFLFGLMDPKDADMVPGQSLLAE